MLHVTTSNGKCMCAHFDLYKLPKSKLTNADIMCLVPFGSSRNKLVQCGCGTVAGGPYDH